MSQNRVPKPKSQVPKRIVGTWSLGFGIFGVEPRDRSGLDSAEQVFLHIADARGQLHRDQSCLLSLFEASELLFKTERAGTAQRGTLEQLPRGHPGREPPGGRQLSEHVQIRNAGEAVGPEGDSHAHRVKRLQRRIAYAGVPVASRTRDDRRPERSQPRQGVAVTLDAVHGKHARVEKAKIGEVLHG